MPHPVAADESARLASLQELAILDTGPEPVYDDIVKLAAAICDTPMALINFVDSDRQWGKALIGLDSSEAPRDASFCARTIVAPDGSLVVPDTLSEPSWATNPQVTDGPRLRFYAGAAIVDDDGHALGSVCVADREPRNLSPEQIDALHALARQAAAHLEARRAAMRLADANAQLREIAIKDALTGLPNRTLLFDRLEFALHLRARTGGDVGVLFCDLNGFKAINDDYGHKVGDEVLRLVARRLTAESRSTDTVARLSGDEFVIVCPEVGGDDGLRAAGERMTDAVGHPGVACGVDITPTISIGCVLAVDGEDAHDVLHRADDLMYRAKRAG